MRVAIKNKKKGKTLGRLRDTLLFAYLISLSTKLLCEAKMMRVIFFDHVNVQSYFLRNPLFIPTALIVTNL